MVGYYASYADPTIKDKIIPKVLDQLRGISPTIYDIIIKSGVSPKIDFMGENLDLVSPSGRVLHAYDVGWLARDGSPIDLSVTVFASDDGEEVHVTRVSGTVLGTGVVTDPDTVRNEFSSAVERATELASRLGLSYVKKVDEENEVRYSIMYNGYPVFILQPQGFAFARPLEAGYRLEIDSAGYLRSFSFTNTVSIIKGVTSLRVEKASVSKDRVMSELGLGTDAEVKEVWVVVNGALHPVYIADTEEKLFVIDASTGKIIANATWSSLEGLGGEGSNEGTITSTNSGGESFVAVVPYIVSAVAAVSVLALIWWVVRRR